MNPYFKDYAEYLSEFFPNEKIQKISVNTGNTCPNRDGTLGYGGCIYCDNSSFTPGYCFTVKGVGEQLEEGKKFFSRKYPRMRFLAYFQSYTGTHRNDPAILHSYYREALDTEGIAGIIIGTRPDCLPDNIIKLLSQLNQEAPVFVELGVETCHDETLKRVNRRHTFSQAEDAICRLSEYGLHTGVHLIAGLPGENRDMILHTVQKVCSLPVESIKLHHMQILHGTPLHKLRMEHKIEIRPFELSEYIDLCIEIVRLVPRSIAIERFLASAPPEKVTAPKWGIKNYEFTHLLLKQLSKNMI
ncbi:MAG: TIGR01212 family radical SAM protein [Candidatus Amulumruptor caecigallinarius]|nr:TIGR01212 family radical SAM protein [Candidatus Amulumruptor caecigallinarius]